MKVAVLTLTRDRLAYTRHCFERLQELAGCEFDHYVLDQGSTDGTREWLSETYRHKVLICHGENVGIHRGLNELLNCAEHLGGDYDVVVKFDNDCELLQPGTLRDVAAAALDSDWLLSPRIEGLRNPPAAIALGRVGGEQVIETAIIGGIFLAAPATIFTEHGYRFAEDGPLWGEDDSRLCAWWRAQGHHVGYVERLSANHYLTTLGQVADIPAYFARRVVEGGRPA